MVDTFVPAKSLIVDWINASAVAGAGNPLPGGAHLRPPASPGVGAYMVLTFVGGNDDPGEANLQRARLSARIYSQQPVAAETAATAYANLLAAAGRSAPTVLPGATMHTVTAITGPVEIPDPSGSTSYMVDADFILQPA